MKKKKKNTTLFKEDLIGSQIEQKVFKLQEQ